jgi:hypothetical protein
MALGLTTVELIASCKAHAQQADDAGMPQIASTLYAAAYELDRLNSLLSRIGAIYGGQAGPG